MDQSQYLAAALRQMSQGPASPQQQAPMQPYGQQQGQDPNARPSIGDNLQQAWQNAQGAPQRAQQSIMGLGQLFKG
ncbi:hypothetical protein [Caulobacter sp. UC70_42]|uniref:hypothetical protein n=1 Tax=Caulobacter sp. UC70_42 TaxID=3374551 RepID=UPI00375713DA